MNRPNRKTEMDLTPITLAVVDGLVWSTGHGHSPTDARLEAAWRQERSECQTVQDLPVLG